MASTVTDPGGNTSGTTYTTPLNQRMRVVLNGSITYTDPLLPGTYPWEETFRLVVYVNNADYAPLYTETFTVPGVATYVQDFDDRILWEGDLPAGVSFGVGIYNTTGNKTATANLSVKYEVANVEYQQGVTVDIAGTAPKMTVADLISGLCNILRLTVRTDDATHNVTFSYYDDFLKAETEGLDWRERIDHNGLEKVQPQVPQAFRFEYKEDNNDQYLRDFKEVQDREYGSYVYTTGGRDGEQKIDVPFAATVQRLTFGNILIPAMRKEGPYYQQAIYEWQPRILVLDGMAEGVWKFNGVVQTEFPRSYFVGTQGRDISLAFGDEVENGGLVRGTVFTRWANYLRRQVSPYLRCRVRVYDDEFMGFSFDRPRLVHDGWHQVWVYVGEIKGKRFGDEAFVECELIPV